MAMMNRISSRFSRCLTSSITTLLHFDSSSSSLGRHSYNTSSLQRYAQEKPKQMIPGNNMKWGSLGPRRDYSNFASGFTPLQQKPLSSIIDIERAKNFSPEDLADIWDDYHLGRGHIGITMKAKLYHLMKQRAVTCRHFVIPLWKGTGYVTMFVQVQMPHIIFTGLEDYKARGTQAAPYFTATYFTEFAETKDMVLVRGDILFTSKLTDTEAQWLLEATQAFYLNDARYKLVEQFNKQTHDFEFKDVLKALDMPVG
ncbi:uncharacterized protein LOC113294372 [Papaver somniferum]|uniref:uncharacterized protein LOC113294372 n=1 Tax=Papaver somniferum TaxID=3469 RepID=UPI000E6FD9D1|nr:uncharacterized protein LOC113294372 [Papaver somniferum]XP_026398548.1 uncharacterized protein LOC113294372 [Papaver somniferum]XP_026398550.1 uncharacterized protein LOC113294372 [Papaver somniferum]XP_026398551.1 uncharacterized protein LOC113294372 [Papaver somniferum]XP_026398552.1 uncharacterized protein LOC113294372 [Papaver somniferum]XP_026398553.1 uncharacterized protein LOC113294372 [Papaver somniferum]XP_026398554.1 uncharacterized protein LOC113294372 [Papaver somniferum]